MTNGVLPELKSFLPACPDCGAEPGDTHHGGCDVERCALCGWQAISCPCVYETVEADLDLLHPRVFTEGPSADMGVRYESLVAAAGGPLPWTGEWPGVVECREFGFYCYWGDRDNLAPIEFGKSPGKWIPCSADHPGAGPDLNRLHEWAKWNSVTRRWERIQS